MSDALAYGLVNLAIVFSGPPGAHAATSGTVIVAMLYCNGI